MPQQKQMKAIYKDWIDANVKDNGYGQCQEMTIAMAIAFPELTRVRGHYYCYGWGEREHWWLITNEGEIIDPTAMQFPSKGIGAYVPLDESLPQPTGMCPNCGGYCYNGGECCSESCHAAYVAYCMNPY